MSTRHEKILVSRLPQALAELLRLPNDQVHLQRLQRSAFDYLVRAGNHSFLIHLKHSGATAPVKMGLDQIRSEAESSSIPLLAVPFMGEVGRKLCSQANVSWIDLSGNADIVAPSLLIRVAGSPNRFKRPGRPSNVFAPKSSRVTRQLLIHSSRPYTQRQLARATGLSDGYVSRIVQRLQDDGLVTRALGQVKVRDPGLLLQAWRESYQFDKHDRRMGNIPARTGIDLIRQLASALTEADIKHVATSLPAAWLMTRYANFRLTTLYLDQYPPDELLQRLGFREEPRGANTWLVIPNDDSVFWGGELHDDIACAHPLQVYLDLQSHPERSKDAAEELKRQYLTYDQFHLRVEEANRQTRLNIAEQALHSDAETISPLHAKLIIESEFPASVVRSILDLKTFRHKGLKLAFDESSDAVITSSLRQLIAYQPPLVEGAAPGFAGDEP